MGWFSFFSSSSATASKEQDITGSLSFLEADMHNHILPGLDDGSENIEDSVSFIKMLYTLGYRRLICTPHVMSDMYPNSRLTIDPAHSALIQRLAEEKVDMPISYSAEYMVNLDFEDIVKQNGLMPFGDNYLLIEMSYLAASPNIKEVIFDLIIKGYKPILAHPERYNYYHQRFEAIEEFRENGCLLQLNLLSLTGYYGKGVKKVAELLIKEKMVSFAGTDLHHERHLGLLQQLAGDKKIMEQLHQIDWKNKTL